MISEKVDKYLKESISKQKTKPEPLKSISPEVQKKFMKFVLNSLNGDWKEFTIYNLHDDEDLYDALVAVWMKGMENLLY